MISTQRRYVERGSSAVDAYSERPASWNGTAALTPLDLLIEDTPLDGPLPLDRLRALHDLLGRDHGTDGTPSPRPVVPAERICERCGSSLVDEYGFCSECAFQNYDRPMAASSGRARAAIGQEGR